MLFPNLMQHYYPGEKSSKDIQELSTACLRMTASVKFACPGQGSQSIGMMKGYADFPTVRETFAEASLVLGQDFWTMVNDGSTR